MSESIEPEHMEAGLLLAEKALLDRDWQQYSMLCLGKPHGDELQPTCPRCFSNDGQWRGYRQRKDRIRVHRHLCKTYGQWFQREWEQ